MKRKPLYGLLAEFETPEQLLEAAQRTHDAGYRKIDAFSPLPIHGLDEAVGYHGTILPAIVFTGGLLGGLTGFGMQWYGMFALNGLPEPYHPVFNVPRFALASEDRFFLVVKSRDKNFDLDKTKVFLDGLKPYGVYEVES